MICCFCARHEEEEDAVASGWIPSFWAQGKEWEGPVCHHCMNEYLFVNHEYDDFELLPGKLLPELAIPLAKRPNMD